MCSWRNNTVAPQKRTACMGMFLRKGRVGGGSLVGLLLLLLHGKRRDDQQDNTWTCGTYQVCVEWRTANIPREYDSASFRSG